jgi:hypothetical protein
MYLFALPRPLLGRKKTAPATKYAVILPCEPPFPPRRITPRIRNFNFKKVLSLAGLAVGKAVIQLTTFAVVFQEGPFSVDGAAVSHSAAGDVVVHDHAETCGTAQVGVEVVDFHGWRDGVEKKAIVSEGGNVGGHASAVGPGTALATEVASVVTSTEKNVVA